jgi:hypothetical protein
MSVNDVIRKVSKDIADQMSREIFGECKPTNGNTATASGLTFTQMISTINAYRTEVIVSDEVPEGRVYIRDNKQFRESDPISEALRCEEPGRTIICRSEDEDKIREAIGEQPSPIRVPLSTKMIDALKSNMPRVDFGYDSNLAYKYRYPYTLKF